MGTRNRTARPAHIAWRAGISLIPTVFHHPVPGYPDGYPVLVSEYVSEKRAGDTYNLLLDGNYLDPAFTSQLTMEMVTYGKEAQVFGYFSAVFDWLSNGDVKMTYTITGLPITIESSANQLAYSVVLIALVCLYCVLAIHDTYSAWSIEKKSRWSLEAFKTTKDEFGKGSEDIKDR